MNETKITVKELVALGWNYFSDVGLVCCSMKYEQSRNFHKKGNVLTVECFFQLGSLVNVDFLMNGKRWKTNIRTMEELKLFCDLVKS